MPINVTLASSLLELEADQHSNAIEAGGRTFKTGIEKLDRDLPGSLWRGGDIVGIGSDMSGGLGNKTDSVPLEIIVTHLLDGYTTTSAHDSTSTTKSDNTNPSVFIVAPPSQATTSIQQIYTKLNTRLLNEHQQAPKRRPSPATASTTTTPPTITTQTKSLLTRISLLQYLSISGLTDSISEILSTTSPRGPQRTIILLQGLPQTLTTTHRRTGTLQTAALLTTLLQSLRNVARVGAGLCLVLVEMDVAWGGGAGPGPGVGGVLSPGNVGTGTGPGPGPGLKTAFSSRTGKTLRIASGAVSGRMLEEGVDVLVVLHDGEGRVGKTQGRNQRIVECVRDERGGRGDAEEDGDAFGAWTVWG